MKTTRIASLVAAPLSILFAASVSAAPASKRTGPAFSNGTSSNVGSSATADHKVMKRVGPAGKGYNCSH